MRSSCSSSDHSSLRSKPTYCQCCYAPFAFPHQEGAGECWKRMNGPKSSRLQTSSSLPSSSLVARLFLFLRRLFLSKAAAFPVAALGSLTSFIFAGSAFCGVKSASNLVDRFGLWEILRGGGGEPSPSSGEDVRGRDSADGELLLVQLSPIEERGVNVDVALKGSGMTVFLMGVAGRRGGGNADIVVR